jgi:hypothetical protein
MWLTLRAGRVTDRRFNKEKRVRVFIFAFRVEVLMVRISFVRHGVE